MVQIDQGNVKSAKHSLSDLYAKWDALADVPLADDETIEKGVLHFAAGTQREEIWHWFERQNPRFIVGEVMQGIRHHDAGNVERTGVFQSPYEQYAARNGLSFVLLGPVDPATYDADDVGPMYRVKFADGEVIEAWPEEVQSALPQLGNVVNDQRKLRVIYESFWDDGVVTTQATLNLDTGEISDIEVADGCEKMEGLQYEEISNATGVSALVSEREDGRRFLANPSLLVQFDQAGSLESAAARPATVVEKFRVLGAHPNRNFFQIEVEAIDGQHAFGVAALLLKEADEEGEAEFFAAIPAATHYELPGESVVTLDTVLDSHQADVFGLAEPETVDDSPSPGM